MNNVEVMGLSVGFLYLGLWTFHSGEMASIIVTFLIFGLNAVWALYYLLHCTRSIRWPSSSSQYGTVSLTVAGANRAGMKKLRKMEEELELQVKGAKLSMTRQRRTQWR